MINLVPVILLLLWPTARFSIICFGAEVENSPDKWYKVHSSIQATAINCNAGQRSFISLSMDQFAASRQSAVRKQWRLNRMSRSLPGRLAALSKSISCSEIDLFGRQVITESHPYYVRRLFFLEGPTERFQHIAQ